jgi:hypothetical protein
MCSLPFSLRPRADLKPFPGEMTALSSHVMGAAASTNLPRSPRAPIAPRRAKRMKNSKSGSAWFSGIPVSMSNWAWVPFPVRASPKIEAHDANKTNQSDDRCALHKCCKQKVIVFTCLKTNKQHEEQSFSAH